MSYTIHLFGCLSLNRVAVCREELEFIANTLIFILAGVIIAGNIYQSEHSVGAPLQIQGRDYGYAFLLWIVLVVSAFSCNAALLMQQLV